MESILLSTLDNGVLTLTLNRPAKLNAIDNALAAALLEELRAAKKRQPRGARDLAAWQWTGILRGARSRLAAT